MIVNEELLLGAVMSSTSNAMAREAAAPLIENWIPRFAAQDQSLEIVGVELGMLTRLDDLTYVIGAQDLIARDSKGYLGGEWKTHKEPRVTKAGEFYKGEGEEDWLREISNGPQLGIYALGLHKGEYYEKGVDTPLRFNEPAPRIMVRAAIKSNPPRYWPTAASGIFEFPPAIFPSIENALRVRAEMIRAARRSGLIPWELPGKHCIRWGRECQFFEQCTERKSPVNATPGIFDKNDPAAHLALPHIPAEILANPDLVVLSSSAYQTGQECLELYRILSTQAGAGDESLALDTGTAFHAGVGSLYAQLRDSQRVPVNATS